MSILKGIFHRYNKSTKEYDTVHLETETAQITDFAEGIVKKLAATTAMSVVSAMSTDSWFANLMKLVLTASGVKYSVGTIGYVCLGSLFGGVIIQWVIVVVSGTSGSQEFPITFNNVYAVVASHRNASSFEDLPFNSSATISTSTIILGSSKTGKGFSVIAIGK